jgi:hypothetical protein
VAQSRKVEIRTVVGVIVGIGIAIAVVELPRIGKVKSVAGAVLIADTDPRKQLPLPNVEITGEVRGVTARTWSDATGFFRLTWPTGLWWGQALRLQFRDADYQPLATTESLTHELYIARLTPAHSGQGGDAGAQETTLANLRIRYSTKAINTVDVGTSSQTFEVANTANVPCHLRRICSPDGRWVATLGSFHMDAGAGQEFQNARVSCVAGPCPFTSIETDDFLRGGRRISGKVRAWSDTVTFLVEAEVERTALSDMIRQSYPSIFGRTMTFTLPPGGEGPSIQADVNGTGIVFPLGPALILSWASCNLQVTADHSKLYSCALKPGYRFR